MGKRLLNQTSHSRTARLHHSFMIELEQTSSPLISVVVLTYNSADTVQETLDSLTRQEFASMEVVVCDDGSTDTTQEIVQAWLYKHGHLFKRAVMLASTVNEGICKNIKKGYAAAFGEWLKPIAGDDFLAPQAVRSFAAAAVCAKHDAIISLMSSFGDGTENFDCLPNSRDISLITGPSDDLRIELLSKNLIPAPGVLLRRSAYEMVGGIDLSFKHLDDWPLWMRFVEKNMSFKILHEVLVYYRVSPKSISSSRLAININKDYLQDLITFYRKYQRQYMSCIQRWDLIIELFRWRMAMGALRSYPRLYKTTILLKALSPIQWIKLIRNLNR